MSAFTRKSTDLQAKDTKTIELIIKPLEACQFQCTYCSSPTIGPAEEPSKLLDLNYVYRFLERFPSTSTIIVNGGEPLLIKPEYYEKLLAHKAAHNYTFTISFTSNLEVFMKNPTPWLPIFKRSDVGVCTSFEYGGLRKKGNGEIYTADDFRSVSNKFLNLVGYRPDFISVITASNYESAIDNVVLASEMGVECKLNYVMQSGHQKEGLRLSKAYKLYYMVHRLGLSEWEYNTKQMLNKLNSGRTTCPLLRSCDDSIRAMNPGGDYYSCGSFADDKTHSIDFDAEMSASTRAHPLQEDLTLTSMKEDCFSCAMFQLCNGCKKTIKDTKKQGLVEAHCFDMKLLEDQMRGDGLL